MSGVSTVSEQVTTRLLLANELVSTPLHLVLTTIKYSMDRVSSSKSRDQDCTKRPKLLQNSADLRRWVNRGINISSTQWYSTQARRDSDPRQRQVSITQLERRRSLDQAAMSIQTTASSKRATTCPWSTHTSFELPIAYCTKNAIEKLARGLSSLASVDILTCRILIKPFCH